MTKAIVDPKKCLLCPDCPPMRICPPKAIDRVDPDYPPFVIGEYCNGCGVCIGTCKACAIELR